jgi:catalase
MPLPSDEKLIALSEQLIAQFDAIFGLHPGFRPAHAKGILLTGQFTPAPEAASLTNAAHITRASTPVSVRFSNSTGLPLIPDNDPNSNPRGMAVRFHLAEHVHTDIVAHSTDGFPTRTGAEFLEFLRALAGGKIEEFLATHPAAQAFVQAPKPTPVSFAQEAYFGVTAFRFTNWEGASRFGRYRILPEAGIARLEEAAAAAKDPDFLMDEIKERIAAGPVGYQVQVQVAADGDVVNDATIHWPEDRPLKAFGKITLTEVIAAQDAEQRKIIFDPIPRLEGIEPSDDPLLELRAAVYLLSGRRRRAAIR